MKFRPVFHKGLYTSRKVRKDELWERDMILAMRPQGKALPAYKYSKVLGTYNKKTIEIHAAIA